MRFDKIIIIGGNTVACNCLIQLCEDVPTEKLFVLESSGSTMSMLSYLCEVKGIEYTSSTVKTEIHDILFRETQNVRSLIISASNRYIFESTLVDNDDIEIINFHYALLPAYRGVNIPSWVIYNGETQTGITWHFVTNQIDHGNILSQRTIPIEEHTTAFDIIKAGMRLSGESFYEFYKVLLEKKFPGKSIVYPENSKLYLSKDLPNNGIIEIKKDSVDTICRTLRAFDHHGITRMPKLKVKYCDDIYTVKHYSISATDEIKQRIWKNNNCLFVIDDHRSICIDF